MAKEKTFTPSLQEVNASVDAEKRKGFRKFFAFLGPAYLVSVGYMDPGNWATDLAGGSQFGYSLLWVLLMSNLIALLLQSLSARLGIVRSRDLAQASREMYPAPVNFCLYFLAEIAIAACDLAEVLGMAIGLQLLFGLSLNTGVLITVLDTFLLLFLLNFGIRKMEAFIISLVFIIGCAFLTEMFFAQPVLADVAKGLVPSIPSDTALYIAIGIIGATVMPHNLYLHSSLVQTRRFDRSEKEIRKAIKFNIIDSAIALNLAFFVNAAILILAASVFYKNGLFEVAEIQDAHKLLAPMLGTEWASILFAVALIAAGQSSTITGTLAGQIVMEGYLNLRIAPWIRRLLTRLIAITPALIAINFYGEDSTGDLLVLSQVILSMQLGFAIIPLIHFVSDKKRMKNFVIPGYVKLLAWLSALVIVSLNVKLVIEQLFSFLSNDAFGVVAKGAAVLVAIGAALLMVVAIVYPFLKNKKETSDTLLHGSKVEFVPEAITSYKKVAIAVDFSASDQKTINHAIMLGGTKARYLLIHVVESAGAFVFGKDVRDFESTSDNENLKRYEEQLNEMGYSFERMIGYGDPKHAIPTIVNAYQADLLVMGAHGHKTFKDMIFGTTVDSVRHKTNVPVLIV
ncbi:MAG TPA: Nramp family divalent metal transporter [Bacteroidia bacterium]|nr:Nramp family divalent metal transporter [Bacteroidia bacterium]HNU32768.1 Nramp family divalent metal transporter [Bacteroidia bacterium]